jgi:23S rRNA-/tRNA-specific pseudouridylate synthase
MVSPNGKPCLTRYKRLRLLQPRSAAGAGAAAVASEGYYSLLEVELLTGRTHQIRAHLSSIDLPIVSDTKYTARKRVKRQLK